MEKNPSMEFDKNTGGIENQLAESKKEIDQLTIMVQDLAHNKKGFNANDILKRIETKLDIMAETDNSEYVDIFLENLRADLEEKQKNLNEKIISVEEIVSQITNLLKSQSLNSQSERNMLIKEFNILKNEVGNLSNNFNQIQENILYLNNKVSETSQKTNETILELDNKKSLESLISTTESVDINVNAVISVLSILDVKIKTMFDNLENMPSIKNIDSLKNDLTEFSQKIYDNLEILKTSSESDDIENVKNEILAIYDKIRNNFEVKFDKIQEELCLLQDKTSISVSNAVLPVKTEMVQLNEKILDLKEYFVFETKNNRQYKEDLAIIVDRFNDIWTSAGLTLDKLLEYMSNTGETAEKLEKFVAQFFESSEDNNLMITGILKKTVDINSSLIEINNYLENGNSTSELLLKRSEHSESQLENLLNGTMLEFQKIQNKLSEINIDIVDKLSTAVENDLNFFRSDILDFQERQEKILEENINRQEKFIENHSSNQESVLNTLSNLHFSITDSSGQILEKVDELGVSIDNINNVSENTLAFVDSVIKKIGELGINIEGINSSSFNTHTSIDLIVKKIEELGININTINSSSKNSLDFTNSVIKKISELSKNIENINNSSTNTQASTEIIKEVLMQIAGWIDDTEGLLKDTNNNIIEIKENDSKNAEIISKKLENEIKSFLNFVKQKQEQDSHNINNKISGVSQELSIISRSFAEFENKVRQDLKSLNNTINEKSDISSATVQYIKKMETNLILIKKDIDAEIGKISGKFEKLELTIEDLEKKLVRIEINQANKTNEQELKQILEFIAGQVTAVNEGNKGNGMLLSKITHLEKRVLDLDENLKKIVTYLDEE